MTILLMCLAILSGSFPSGVVLSRLLAGRDVRTMGSGNIGAANVAREAGLKLGVSVAALDIVKGVIPVMIGILVGQGSIGLALVALCAVLGHDFSLFLHFRGGKGVATTLGVAVTLAPLAASLTALTWLAIVVLRGYASLASLAALALLPVYMGLTHQPPVYVILAFALFILAIAKHWPNILRLLNGTEPGLWHRRTADGG